MHLVCFIFKSLFVSDCKVRIVKTVKKIKCTWKDRCSVLLHWYWQMWSIKCNNNRIDKYKGVYFVIMSINVLHFLVVVWHLVQLWCYQSVNWNCCRMTKGEPVLKAAPSSRLSLCDCTLVLCMRSKSKRGIRARCFHWSWSVSLSRKCDRFIIVVLQQEDLRRNRGSVPRR